MGGYGALLARALAHAPYLLKMRGYGRGLMSTSVGYGYQNLARNFLWVTPGRAPNERGEGGAPFYSRLRAFPSPVSPRVTVKSGVADLSQFAPTIRKYTYTSV